MKQNKNYCHTALLAFFLLFYFCVAFYLGAFPKKTPIGDVGTYIRNISEEYITNWHSSLFIYEGIILKRLLIFAGFPSTGTLSYLCMYYAGVVIIGACMTHWLHKALRIHWTYGLLIPCWVLASILLYRYTYGSLDFFFIAVTSLYTSVILENRNIKSRCIFKLALLILLMVHMVAFRKNSICIMPILFWMISSFESLCSNKIKRFIISIVSSLTIFFVANSLPTTEKTYPMYPMMSSDMKITDILLGKELSGKNPYYTINIHEPVSSSTIKGHFPEYCGILYKRSLNNSEYDAFINLYKEYWCHHTKEMLIALVVQRIQFYNRGITPKWLIHIVESHYQHIKNNTYAWKLTHTIKYGNYLLILVIMLPACIYAIINISKLFQKFSDGQSCITQACWAALVYLGSFLLVTPVPSVRYIMPSVFVLSIVSFILSLNYFKRFLIR